MNETAIAEVPVEMHRRAMREYLFSLLGLLSVGIALLVLAALLINVAVDGAPRISWQFLTSFPSRFAERAGVYSALVGSAYLIGLTALIAMPIGIGAAIYLEEYANDNWFTRFIELNIANLAGVPSIIYGILGLQVFVRFLSLDRSLIAGALTMSLLILPVIIIASREALRTVPQSLRDGALALGATRWQAVRDQVLPLALPGVLTGCILGLSRAIGETAPLITMGALTYVAFVPNSLFSPFTVLPIQSFNWLSRPQESFHANAAAAIVVLLALLLTMNATAIILRNRFEKRYRL
ncbi:MAG: phosphate ABC transporter permease PstA [Deltaproteobacteria bacterium]|nr:phosphate ABC transporter permease PstA [Deltaproteobacteria bacterium]